jgi:arylsulfatase A-like enzyme
MAASRVPRGPRRIDCLAGDVIQNRRRLGEGHFVVGVLLLAFGVVTTLPGCGPDQTVDGPPSATAGAHGRRPDILLIVIDTLRRDHLGSYGWHRDTSPSIDALASDAVRFDRAYAAAPWTQPSVATILTGLYPTAHGLTRIARLPDSLDTLPERLGRHGYATAAIVSHVLLARVYNFDQGFDEFKVAAALPTHEVISTERVTDRATESLERLANGPDPYLLFVHYFDPHYQYRRHPEHGFSSDGAGRLVGGEDIETLRTIMESATPEELQFVLDVYDEEVRHTDVGVGRLLAKLRELGRYDDTLIIVTADHGEEFLDHGWLGHTRSLYEELVRVPLIIRPPAMSLGARVVESPVSLASIAPTVLELAGVESPSGPGRTVSLLPLLQHPASTPDETGVISMGEGESVADTILLEVDFTSTDPRNEMKTTRKKALIEGDHKLIRDDLSGRVELYDLSVDSREREDLSSRHPEIVERMQASLQRRIEAVGASPTPTEEIEHGASQIEELRSLGYVEP